MLVAPNTCGTDL